MITLIKKNPAGVITGVLHTPGEVVPATKKAYSKEIENPFDPTDIYRFIPFWEEDIECRLLGDNSLTEELRVLLDIEIDGRLYLQWKSGKFVHTRKIDAEQLPPPVRLKTLHLLEFRSKYTSLPEPFNIERITRVHTPGIFHKMTIA